MLLGILLASGACAQLLELDFSAAVARATGVLLASALYVLRWHDAGESGFGRFHSALSRYYLKTLRLRYCLGPGALCRLDQGRRVTKLAAG